MDTEGYRVARIWHRAGEFIPGRLARACGDGQWARRKTRLRVYHRWAARAALRGKARASDAGAENRLPDHGVSHRRRPRKNVYKDLGSLSAAHAFCTRRDLICAADLRAGGRQCGSDGSETRRNAARTRTCPQYRRRLVSVKRRHPRKIPHPIQSLTKEAHFGAPPRVSRHLLTRVFRSALFSWRNAVLTGPTELCIYESSPSRCDVARPPGVHCVGDVWCLAYARARLACRATHRLGRLRHRRGARALAVPAYPCGKFLRNARRPPTLPRSVRAALSGRDR